MNLCTFSIESCVFGQWTATFLRKSAIALVWHHPQHEIFDFPEFVEVRFLLHIVAFAGKAIAMVATVNVQG